MLIYFLYEHLLSTFFMYGAVPGARDTEMALVLREVTFHQAT